MLDPSNIDFKAMGFHAGLEIHHQLRSKRKLFCNCTTELDTELMKKGQFTFERRFRAVMGEMGDFDAGMLVEFEKGYQVIYHANDQHVCTYEMDETPPFWPDQEAIEVGMHLSYLFNCDSRVDELQVNRKQYLDGSITTGFQRTMIVARDGHVELTSGKKVRISNILVEEDAARKIKTENRGRTVYYNLDRLGVPLTEIITNHLDVDTPEELVEAARIIGLTARTSGLVKRGIGVARQDVNISITGGNRAELKGVQDLALFPKLCAHEVCRQHALIAIQEEIAGRAIKTDDFNHTYVEVSQHFSDLAEGESVYAVRLPQFEDLLLTEVQPSKDFGMEIFEKCTLITGIQPNELFHSGEILSSSIRRKENPQDLFVDHEQDREVRKALKISKGDAYIAARGPTKRVLHVMKKVIERAKIAFDGVPQETRQILPNGNNIFLRVIHGKERLYPDTDTPPILFDRSRLLEIKTTVQPGFMQYFRKYEGKGLSFEQLAALIRSERIPMFIYAVEEVGTAVQLAIEILSEIHVWLRREGFDSSNIQEQAYKELFIALKQGRISHSSLNELLKKMCQLESQEEQIGLIEEYKVYNISRDELKRIIEEVIAETKTKVGRNVIIGKVMAKYNYRLHGREVAQVVEELL